MPQITIGLPVYNSRATLGIAIQSVLDQTFTDWELVICDDASTDNSLAIAESFDDPRIRVIRNETNGGLSVALNRIIDVASAPLMARMDSDDLLHPERIARQFSMFERYSNLEVVSTDAFVVDRYDRVLGGRRKGVISTKTVDILRHNGPIHASIMATKEWCARYPYLDHMPRGEDLELWARALPHTEYRHLSERLYFIREDPHLDVAKYCRTISAHSEVFRMFSGEDGISFSTAKALVFRSYVRMGAYQAAGMFGMQSRIAARRVEKLADEELRQAQSVVDQMAKNAAEREETSLAVQ
jgi:glycosyltransferase involved in cell wall biosynthesis